MLYACDAPCLAERYRVAAAGVYVGLRLCRIGRPQRAPAAAAATLPAATPCYFWPAAVVSEFINLYVASASSANTTTTTSLVECYRNHIITQISIIKDRIRSLSTSLTDGAQCDVNFYVEIFNIILHQL